MRMPSLSGLHPVGGMESDPRPRLRMLEGGQLKALSQGLSLLKAHLVIERESGPRPILIRPKMQA